MSFRATIRRLLQDVLPLATWRGLARWRNERFLPPVGRFCFGDFRRLTPVSREWGFERGLPVDRYYIDQFLHRCSNDIRGRVLEIGDNSYTRKFGGNRVLQSDVLHVAEGNSSATIIGDLTAAPQIPSNSFDCAIITQTLHLIYDFRAAVATLHRILKPEGVLLLTVPYINQLQRGEWGSTWFWGFTELSMQRVCREFFPPERVTVNACGNVLAAVSFLQGLASQELSGHELDHCDPLYQLIVTVRAVKSGSHH